MAERLRTDQREEMEAAVLAYLRSHGPQPLSEIRWALDAVMSVHFASRTIKELLAAGELATRNALFHRPINGKGSPITYPYKAAVYEVAKGKGRRGKTTPGKALAPKRKAEAPPKPADPERPKPGPRSFTEERRQDLRSRILAYLAEYGPSPVSDLRLAFAPIVCVRPACPSPAPIACVYWPYPFGELFGSSKLPSGREPRRTARDRRGRDA